MNDTVVNRHYTSESIFEHQQMVESAFTNKFYSLMTFVEWISTQYISIHEWNIRYNPFYRAVHRHEEANIRVFVLYKDHKDTKIRRDRCDL